MSSLTWPPRQASTSLTLQKCEFRRILYGFLQTFGVVSVRKKFVFLISLEHFGLVTFRYPVPQRSETQGRTEEYVGRWLKQSLLPRDSVVLATKVCALSQSVV